MKVSERHVVTLSYVLTVDNNIVDKATEDSPFSFIHGIGQTLPAFDEQLEGKEAGDEFKFTLDAENGYGEHSDQMIQSIDRQIFAEAPENEMFVGNALPMQFGDPNNPGQVHQALGTIVELNDLTVKMDFNHPLAGKTLNFAGKILNVRPATEEELSHGHAHGVGGHQH